MVPVYRGGLGGWVVAVTLGLGATAVAVTPISPVVVDHGSGNSYQLLSNGDWTDSQAEAQRLGGNLATIANQEQQNFVFGEFGAYGGTQRILWIGLYDPSHDQSGGTHASNFRWVSGDPVTYTHWDVGEPNDTGGVEFWAAMYYPNYHNPGSWNDWTNRAADPIGIPFHGVVQFNPLPGDANNDGRVDFTDLLTLAQHYGATGAGWSIGDFNRDGTINFDDLVILAQRYGQSAVAVAAVPEPLIPAGVLLVLPGLLRRGHR